MIFVSCDQSTSHCALTLWDGVTPIGKKIIKTGSSHSKTRSKGVAYFEIITNQIDYVCDCIVEYIQDNKAELFVMESPSQGSYGDAKSVLIVLFRAIQETIKHSGLLADDKVVSYAPTAVKAFAREYLPEDQRMVGDKKLKMEKKHMVQACELHAPDDWLAGITLTEGKADFADSYWIGKIYLSGKAPTKKKVK